MNKELLRNKLEEEKNGLLNLLASIENDDVLESDSWQTVDEVGDESFESQERMSKQEKLDLVNDLLRRTEQALVDLNADRYGICNMCEKQIAEDRLLAHPHVQYCVECQGKIDEKE